MSHELSRRDFLKLSGAAGVAVSAATVLGGLGTSAAAVGADASGNVQAVAPQTWEAPGEVKQSYFRIGSVNCLLNEPVAPGEHSQIMVIDMHGGVNKSIAGNFVYLLASYGFTTMYGSPDSDSFIDQYQEMGRMVQWARRREGITKVIVMGQSRGGSVCSGYQAIAENGAKLWQGPERLCPIPDMNLDPADGVMILDANYGFQIMHLMSLNPALKSEESVWDTDPELEAQNPDNGWGIRQADGSTCTYDEPFRRKYLNAQAKRYNSLIKMAKERWDKIDIGEGKTKDNEPFPILDAMVTNRIGNLMIYDLRLLAHTKKAWPLMHKDGSITEEIVYSVRSPQNLNNTLGDYACIYPTTVKDFLWLAMEVDEDAYDYDEDGLYGINLDTCVASPAGNAGKINCPILIIGHTAGHEYMTAEWAAERAISKDKTILFNEGATHNWTPIDRDKYGDTMENEAKFVAKWLTQDGRFVVFTPKESDAEFLQKRTAGILSNGLSTDNLVLNGRVLSLVIDGREFILSTNASNRNIDGEIAIGDGFYLVFDIKGNGSNVKEFKVVKK